MEVSGSLRCPGSWRLWLTWLLGIRLQSSHRAEKFLTAELTAELSTKSYFFIEKLEMTWNFVGRKLTWAHPWLCLAKTKSLIFSDRLVLEENCQFLQRKLWVFFLTFIFYFILFFMCMGFLPSVVWTLFSVPRRPDDG